MNTEPKLGLQVKIISVVGDAEYEGKTYGYYVRVENQDGVQWDLLDSDMQASPELIGKMCHVEMLAFLGKIELQEGSEKAMRTGSIYLPMIFGQIVDLAIVPFTQPLKPSVDLELILDVGDGLIESVTVYHFEHEDEIASLTFKVGDFVTHDLGRMDLRSISC